MTIAARGWYHGWNVVFATIVSQIAAYGLGVNSLSLFLHDWAGDLHSPASKILLAMPALGAAVAILSPMVGSVADRYPARWLFALGLIGIAIFSVAMSAVTATWQIWVLYGTLFPTSITLCSTIASNAIVSRWFVRRAGLALGLSGTGLGIAGVVLPLLTAFTMPIVGWREVWRAAGILTALVVLPFVVWIVRERSTERDGFQYMDGVAAASLNHGHGLRNDDNLRWRDILTSRNFWLLAFCFIPIVGLYFGTQQNLALIVASRGMTAKTASFLLAVFALLHVIATPILGLASDRFGSRRPLVFVGILAMIGAVLFGYGDSLPVLLAAIAFIGFSGSLWSLVAAAILAEFGARGVGRAFGALMLCLPVNMLSAAFIAKAQESTGSYGPPFLALGLLCLLGGTCALLMRERQGGHPTTAEKPDALIG
jgi:MFS family permease